MKRFIALMIGVLLSTVGVIEVSAQTAAGPDNQQVQQKGAKNMKAKGKHKPSKREKGKAEVQQAEQQRKASIGQGK